MSDEEVVVVEEVPAVEPEVIKETLTDEVTEPELKPEKTSEELRNEALSEKFKVRQERRELKAERDELDKLKAVQANANQKARPTVPDLPDQYDDDFSKRLAARETAIREVAEFDANARSQEALTGAIQQQTQVAEQKQHADVIAGYTERGHKYGLTEEDLTKHAERAGVYGITPDETRAMLTDEVGPLMVKLLADNPAEAEKFASQPPGLSRLMALRQKASGTLNKKTTETPDPVHKISGDGAAPQGRPILKDRGYRVTN